MMEIKTEYEDTVDISSDDISSDDDDTRPVLLPLRHPITLFVCTTRLDDMRIFQKNLDAFHIKNIISHIENESKPRIKYFPKYTPPSKSSFEAIVDKIDYINNKASVVERNTQLLKLCKPLKIVLTDFRKHKVFDTKERCDNVKYNEFNKPDKRALILRNTTSKEIEIYNIGDSSNITEYGKIKETPNLNIHNINIGRLFAKFEYCCWYERKKILDVIKNTVLKHYSDSVIKYLNRPHECNFGQCKCCCYLKGNDKSIFESGKPLSSLEKDLQHQTSSRLKQASNNLSDENNNPWRDQLLSELDDDSIISKALRYERRRSEVHNTNEIENRNLETVIEFQYDTLSVKNVFYYFDKSGNLLAYEKGEDKHSSSKGEPNFKFQFSPCCWISHKQVVNSIRKIKPTSVRFMSVPHQCQYGNCKCCCKSIRHLGSTLAISEENDEKENPMQQNLTTQEIAPQTKNLETTENTETNKTKENTEQNSEVSVDVLISTILERFKDVKLSINEDGKVAVALSTPVASLSSAELKVLSQILSHAQKTVTELGILPGSNLIMTNNDILSPDNLIENIKLNYSNVNSNSQAQIPQAPKSNNNTKEPKILNYLLDTANKSNSSNKSQTQDRISSLQSLEETNLTVDSMNRIRLAATYVPNFSKIVPSTTEKPSSLQSIKETNLTKDSINKSRLVAAPVPNYPKIAPSTTKKPSLLQSLKETNLTVNSMNRSTLTAAPVPSTVEEPAVLRNNFNVLSNNLTVILDQKNTNYISSFEELTTTAGVPIIENVFSLQDTQLLTQFKDDKDEIENGLMETEIDSNKDVENTNVETENKLWYRKPEGTDVLQNDNETFEPVTLKPIKGLVPNILKRKLNQPTHSTSKIRVLSPSKLGAPDNSSVEKNSAAQIPSVSSAQHQHSTTAIIVGSDLFQAKQNTNKNDVSNYQNEFISTIGTEISKEVSYVDNNTLCEQEIPQFIITKPQQKPFSRNSPKTVMSTDTTINRGIPQKIPTTIVPPLKVISSSPTVIQPNISSNPVFVTQPNIISNPVFLISPLSSSTTYSRKPSRPVGNITVPSNQQVPNAAAPTILHIPVTNGSAGISNPISINIPVQGSVKTPPTDNAASILNATPILLPFSTGPAGVATILKPIQVPVSSESTHVGPSILKAVLANPNTRNEVLSNNSAKSESSPFISNTNPVLESIIIDEVDDSCDDEKEVIIEETKSLEDLSILGM